MADTPKSDDEELAELARYYQAADDHKLDLLRRLGRHVPDISSPEYVKEMYAMTRKLGLSDQDFFTMDPAVFVSILETKVQEVELQKQILDFQKQILESRVTSKGGVSLTGKAAGRPAAEWVNLDRAEVKKLRRGFVTQEKLAGASALSTDLIQDAEAGRPVTERTAEGIASGLSKLLKRPITVADLMPKKPKK